MRALSGVKSLNLAFLATTSLSSKILSSRALAAGSLSRGASPVFAESFAIVLKAAMAVLEASTSPQPDRHAC